MVTGYVRSLVSVSQPCPGANERTHPHCLMSQGQLIHSYPKQLGVCSSDVTRIVPDTFTANE